MPIVKLFPVPPPTNNDLTSQQRAQLLRKTKKIEQLLGATPHLIDISPPMDNPIRVALPQSLVQRRRSIVHDRRSSLDSSTSGSSTGSSHLSFRRASSSASTYSSKRKMQHSPSVLEQWPRSRDVPVLRLAMESLTLESIPASPSSDCTSSTDSDTSPQNWSTSSSPATSVGDSSDSEYSREPRDLFLLETQFIIPTTNSLRKQKMDRIRKKLGADVPFHLVFPSEENPIRKGAKQHLNVDKACPPLPLLPAARPRSHTGPRISQTRDSIVDAASIHRARRLAQAASTTGLPHQKSVTASIASSDFGRVHHRLSFIIESPNEHAAEDFSLHVSRVTSELSEGDVLSEWFGSDIKLWTATDHEARNSTVSVINTEPKRRPSSYRKPPPAMPSDILNEIIIQ